MGRFHESIFGVYFDDLDPFMILHNARYLLLFERAIGELWGSLGWGGELDYRENHDQFHVVASNHIDYKRPVRGIGKVRVRLSVDRIGESSLTLAFRVMPLDEDIDYATGSRVLVCVDPDRQKPRPWSDEFRTKLAPYLE